MTSPPPGRRPRDMVFAKSATSGMMAAINLNTGERVWSRDVGGIQTPWAAGDFRLCAGTTERTGVLPPSARTAASNGVPSIVALGLIQANTTTRSTVGTGSPFPIVFSRLVGRKGGFRFLPIRDDLLGAIDIPTAPIFPLVVPTAALSFDECRPSCRDALILSGRSTNVRRPRLQFFGPSQCGQIPTLFNRIAGREKARSSTTHPESRAIAGNRREWGDLNFRLVEQRDSTWARRAVSRNA